MKPFAIYLSPKDTVQDGPFLQVCLMIGRGDKLGLERTLMVTSFAEIERAVEASAAARLAAPEPIATGGERNGTPGVTVWVGAADRKARKPAGFDAFTSKLSKRFFPATPQVVA